ncbi:LamG domain-containing protein [Curtobacterium sp. MCBD17_008]|uniref:LamG domain-containing protein n=1 Tax=Curtobacterium sp. MCBD17_008 TaxID=2175656 RepID=UPI000DAA936C|nr:LamG domain-containing protein [Curtobacterium sp. MCBD17_008]PZE88382.1 LamG domain-containing protein [Curtobacterium sp. MCBD17_008]
MNPGRLRDGKVVAVLLVVALAVVLLVNQFAPTRSGFSAKVTNGSNSAGTAASNTCTGAVGFDATASNALFAYKLTEPSGSTTAADFSGKGANGTYQGGMTASTPSPIACPRDPGTAWLLDGASDFLSTPAAQRNPVTFSEEVWFRTSVAGGLLIGFGGSQVTVSGQHDRQVYLNTNGQLVFGAYNGATQVVTSPKSYNDGAWHHVVSTMSATTGMRLYVDGALVASNANYTAPENYTGYWRIGYDTISGWPGAPANPYFTGSMRFAAVYNSVLTAAQVSSHYAAGR